ncbi:uncharacterized protein LOC112596613 [Melanaphis sacchari]|uniref:uncharacterized protein LOC112596613 n=1 Tax=Melanaphis sacchari TaxID=742174 RepID=UPI000DC14656|nr:uncharacterized protein LOC112596613 [Melanaphis sacchari]
MSVVLHHLNICRICLSERNLRNILMFGTTTIKWIEDIKAYYKIELSSHDNKSTKLCIDCMNKVEKWRKIVDKAVSNQTIVEFFAEKLQEEMKRNKDGI